MKYPDPSALGSFLGLSRNVRLGMALDQAMVVGKSMTRHAKGIKTATKAAKAARAEKVAAKKKPRKESARHG
mgnify:CR=1 FL=1